MDSFLDELFKIREEDLEDEYPTDCCGMKMEINGDSTFLVCNTCGGMVPYIEEYYQDLEPQMTRYDEYGNIHFGDNVKKTTSDRIKDLSCELLNNKVTDKLDNKTVINACHMVYNATCVNTKKKENRKQLFAAALFLSAIKESYIYTPYELATMFNLETKGISKGINYLLKHAIKNGLSLKVDPAIESLLVKKYLDNFASNSECLTVPADEIVTEKNIEFCVNLIELMQEYCIAYDTKIYTKATASVYYLIKKEKLYKGTKKNLFSYLGGVGQNTATTTLNVLITPEVQELLPEYMRMPVRISG